MAVEEVPSDLNNVLGDDIDFDAYSNAELLHFQQELNKKIQLLTLENSTFESFLVRLYPQALKPDGDQKGGGKKGGGIGLGASGNGANLEDHKEKELQNRREERKRKRGEKVKETEEPTLLTAQQKSEVATRELEELRDEMEHQRVSWEKDLDNLKAEIEEIEIRLAEIKKADFEFRRDIVTQARNQRTGKIMAERVTRYFEEKIRAKDAAIEKVRLKNVTLRIQKNKLQLQLKQKEEMGEVLHAIDFDQLKIENRQYANKIEERNNELLKLKMTAGRTVQILNFHKKKLNLVTEESEKLRNEINQRKELLLKLNAESILVQKGKHKAENINEKLVNQMNEYKVPDVMEYVNWKAKFQELLVKVGGWERKVEIAEMALKRMQRVWYQINKKEQQTLSAESLPKSLPALP